MQPYPPVSVGMNVTGHAWQTCPTSTIDMSVDTRRNCVVSPMQPSGEKELLLSVLVKKDCWSVISSCSRASTLPCPLLFHFAMQRFICTTIPVNFCWHFLGVASARPLTVSYPMSSTQLKSEWRNDSCSVGGLTLGAGSLNFFAIKSHTLVSHWPNFDCQDEGNLVECHYGWDGPF